MRIEAHLTTGNVLLKVRARSYAEADSVRREVSASRYARTLSDPQGGMWAFKYPLSVDKCREMRKAWGEALKVAKPLAAWYREASVDRATQVGLTKHTDAELPVLARRYPAFNAWLKGDQRVTAAWMAGAYRGGGLLADEVGTGKTAGVVAGLIEGGYTGNILVVCPKISVKAVWGKEFAQHCPDVPVYLARGTRNNREKNMAAYAADSSPAKVLVIVSEMLRIKAVRERGRVTKFLGYEYPELMNTEWNAVVLDESHKLLGAMDVVKANLAGEGLKALSYAPNRLKLAVTATPFGKGGKVEALFGTLHWLWPDEFKSKWAWLGEHFNVQEDEVFVRGATQTFRRVLGLRDGGTEQAFWESLGPRVLRRTMEEVSPAHRGLKNWITVTCEMDSVQTRQYKQFTEDAELAVDGGIITTVGVLDYLTRCRQFANGVLRKEGGRVVYTGESCKIDMLLAHLERLQPNRKVVITSQYNEFLDAVEERLAKEDYRWFRLDGSTSDIVRESIMNDFQGEQYRGLHSRGPVQAFRGPGVTCPTCHVGASREHGTRCPVNRPRLFLLNSQAGGVSITLDAADEMHQLDRMYPPEANTQLYGRIFRRGRVHEVFFYLYEAEGTVDQQITEKTEAGHAAQMRLLDGRRGIDYVRKLAKYEPK